MTKPIAILPASDPGFVRRTDLFSRWLNAAKSLAANDEEAQRVVAFLQERAVLACPRRNDSIAYFEHSHVQPSRALYIVVMLGIDHWTLGPDDPRLGYASHERAGQYDEALGQYRPNSRVIYMAGEWQRADISRTLTLLHEGLHAYEHLVMRRHRPRSLWEEERDAILLQIRLIRNLGGPEFQAHLDAKLPEVKQQYDASSASFTYEPSEHPNDDALLDQVLWPASGRNGVAERLMRVADCTVLNFLMHTFSDRRAHSIFSTYVRENRVDTTGSHEDRRA
jgi:hypothetical protein